MTRKSFPNSLQSISKLPSATRPPVCVSSNDTIERALTIMMASDYSQLPVSNGPRNFGQVVTWRNVGQMMAIKENKPLLVRDIATSARVVTLKRSLYETVHDITKHGFVLVESQDKKLGGIVTATDLADQFSNMSVPFLLLEEIEVSLRLIIADNFTHNELLSCRHPDDEARTISKPSDLSLGECIILISPEKRWCKLNVNLDRKSFLDHLHKVGVVRNRVMHFHPDGLDSNDLYMLKKFAVFIRQLALSVEKSQAT